MTERDRDREIERESERERENERDREEIQLEADMCERYEKEVQKRCEGGERDKERKLVAEPLSTKTNQPTNQPIQSTIQLKTANISPSFSHSPQCHSTMTKTTEEHPPSPAQPLCF